MLREALPEIVTGSVPGAKAKAILDRRNEAAPDIIATAKSMGAGVPISAISAREEVMDAAPAGTIGGTYCGNPLACAAAIKTMEIMKEEDYCAKSLHIGSVVRKAFEEMKEKYDIIGDVRGIGGMLGVEFVKDKESKEPNPEFVSKLVQTALQKGLLLEMQAPPVML